MFENVVEFGVQGCIPVVLLFVAFVFSLVFHLSAQAGQVRFANCRDPSLADAASFVLFCFVASDV